MLFRAITITIIISIVILVIGSLGRAARSRTRATARASGVPLAPTGGPPDSADDGPHARAAAGATATASTLGQPALLAAPTLGQPLLTSSDASFTGDGIPISVDDRDATDERIYASDTAEDEAYSGVAVQLLNMNTTLLSPLMASRRCSAPLRVLFFYTQDSRETAFHSVFLNITRFAYCFFTHRIPGSWHFMVCF